MLALHGVWNAGSLLLWAETDTPAPPKRGFHPFHARPEVLRGALGEWARGLRAADRLLPLPTVSGLPVASPQLLSPPKARGRAKLRNWRVGGLLLPAPDALESLPLLSPQPGVALGDDLLFWRGAAKVALELVARQRFVPLLRQNEEAPSVGWQPVADPARLARLAESMPPACANGTSAREAVEGFLARGVDGLLRRWLSEERWSPPEEPLLRGLVDGAPRAPVSPSVVAAWETWSRGLEVEGGPCRTLLRLEEPANGGGRGWRLGYFLQGVEDPSLLVPAGEVWRLRAHSPLGRLFPRARERLLADLGRASRLFPPLERSLRSPQPTGARLSTEEAHRFLREGAPLLRESGVGVQVPSWWRGREPVLGLRLHVRPVKGAGPGAGSLLRFDWRLAVGGAELSPEEFEVLARQKEGLVRVRGQWVELPSREQLEEALRRARSRPRGTLLEALGSSSTNGGLPVLGVHGEGWVREVLGALRGDSRVEMVPPPRTLRGTLRPYQLRGLSWLRFLREWGLGGCLADDMGLGKTIQVIALLLHAREAGKPLAPTLVVCPTSVAGNWQRELERFAPALKVMVHHGGDRLREGEFARAAKACDVVITTYALCQRGEAALAGVRWGCVVLDEAQNIKNPRARGSRFVRSLPSGQRFALTGTPVENRLSELWSILDFLNPGYLGPLERFHRAFAIPVERYQDKEAAGRLRSLVQPFVLRRLKSDPAVVRDLPEKVEGRVACTLTPEQATLYEAVVREGLGGIEKASGIQRRGQILAVLTKLKQVCDHPALFLHDGSRLEGRSGKLARLAEMLEEAVAAGDRALVFTQFAEMGRLLERYLGEALGQSPLFLHGGTPRKERDRMVESFQNGGPPVLLLSLKAGGLGLNLTAASHVFHFDRWWNPAVESQATDRAHRIGQKRRVHVHKFLCAGTLEERIDGLLERKKRLAEMTVGTGEAWLTELSTSELRELFALRREMVFE